MFGNTSIFECSHVQVHAAKNDGKFLGGSSLKPLNMLTHILPSDAAYFSRADLNSHKYHAGRYVDCALWYASLRELYIPSNDAGLGSGARILKKNEERHHQTIRCRSKHTQAP